MQEKVLTFLTGQPTLMYSVDELVAEFKVDKVTMNSIVSKLYDERKVKLRVQGGKVYVGVRR